MEIATQPGGPGPAPQRTKVVRDDDSYRFMSRHTRSARLGCGHDAWQRELEGEESERQEPLQRRTSSFRSIVLGVNGCRCAQGECQ